MKKYTKTEAIAIVCQCAAKYHAELNERNLLFMCSDKHKQLFSFEFSFHRSNYMHLTGLKSGLSSSSKLFANDFYKKCLEHKLSPEDFDFAEDGTTHLKLAVLPKLVCKNLHASIIGNYDSSKPLLYTERIVGNVNACMGFIMDKKNSEYVPNTVIQEDIRNITSSTVQVVAAYRKGINAKLYEEMTYKSKKTDWESIKYPEKYQYLLSLTS